MSVETRSRVRVKVGIEFHHPLAFWVGTTLISAGVCLHLPDFFMMRDMGYMMAGMPMSPSMEAGMAAIICGIGLAAYGLIPRRDAIAKVDQGGRKYHLRAMDDARLTGAHWGLLFVLGVALIVDVMKPATLGFVVPGMREEYGLSTQQALLLPLFALTGTTIGSFLWGMVADRVGRRAAIMFASLIFIGTAICGFMPSFGWNLLMCFVMGLSAGGMLPIVYALMAESVPAHDRGWLVVLHGGMGTVGGFLAASGLAMLLEPHFGWRILWLAGLPTGLLVLFLNRWIPESPRFLLERGRIDDARAVMARYGVEIEEDTAGATAEHDVMPVQSAAGHWSGLTRLFRGPLASHSIVVGLYGLAWGLVNWGFLTMVPTILRDKGIASGSVSSELFLAALIAVPGTVAVAYLYGRWSSKRSMIGYALATAVTLLAFAFVNPGAGDETTLKVLMVALLVTSGGVISMLSPYTAEVYPTELRGTGSGLAAGASKMGGIIGPQAAGLILGISTGFAGVATMMAVPSIVAAVALVVKGVETKGRGLEEIEAQHLLAVPDPVA
ncbi:MAG TPA: MFS transporter [Actinomycetota bacterium]